MTTENGIGNLSEAARGETRADLSAGSAGYQHFLEELSGYISPEEAVETRARFKRGWKWMLLATVLFFVMYAVINQLLGPRSLAAAGWGNDFLRGVLFLAAVIFVRAKRIGVAGQMLLPLASLCFLPMPLTGEPDWGGGPVVFGGTVAVLFVIGWFLDAAADERPGRFGWRRWMPLLAVILFLTLAITAHFGIVDQAPWPVFSIAAGVVGALYLEKSWFAKARKAGGNKSSDVDFLYGSAWKRWRFFISGRVLAIILGIVPFLLFANLLDYQEEMEHCLEVEKAPEILRVDFDRPTWFGPATWEAFYWRQEGRFMRVSDFDPAAEGSGVDRRIYLVASLESLGEPPMELPAHCAEAGKKTPLPTALELTALQDRMQDLNGRRMERAEFEEAVRDFEGLRITSRCRLLRQLNSKLDIQFVAITYCATPKGGVCFAENLNLISYDPQKIGSVVTRYSTSKWVFFVFGIMGFIFVWRRGGDSSLARWIGLWLVGTSVTPSITASDDTLPHLSHWLWQQSVMYHWNTLASMTQPMFNLLFLATATILLLWAVQISPAVCWTYLCWPTRIYPKWPGIVRHLIIFGKLAGVIFVNVIIFGVVCGVWFIALPQNPGLGQYVTFTLISTAVFLSVGWVLRRFTCTGSEVPKLGAWPAIAMVMLNLAMVFYAPVVAFIDGHMPSMVMSGLGTFFGCAFIVITAVLILKRDFLRVRAIAGFTTLLLVLLVPLVAHFVEDSLPRFLTSGPFFRERGAEMVVIMLVVLAFPWLHRQLHELLLLIAVPKLRHIEHSVEHAMEKIVDAENDAERAHLISELFEHLKVPQYLFLSRRPKGLFMVDINKLGREEPTAIELSESLREFLGERRNFVDLQNMAFEWPFFFHQFELHRLAEKTGCRYVLPVLVGESLRGLLLLPDGPGGSVVSNPAVSVNINNFGIAAALSRPGR